MIKHGEQNNEEDELKIKEIMEVINMQECLEKHEKMVLLNPDDHNSWNRLKEELVYSNVSDMKEIYLKQFKLTQMALEINPKSYATWYHRYMLFQRFKDYWFKEHQLCNILLSVDKRNFHCWNYCLKNGFKNKLDLHNFTSMHFATFKEKYLFLDPNDEGVWAMYEKRRENSGSKGVIRRYEDKIEIIFYSVFNGRIEIQATEGKEPYFNGCENKSTGPNFTSDDTRPLEKEVADNEIIENSLIKGPTNEEFDTNLLRNMTIEIRPGKSIEAKNHPGSIIGNKNSYTSTFNKKESSPASNENSNFNHSRLPIVQLEFANSESAYVVISESKNNKGREMDYLNKVKSDDLYCKSIKSKLTVFNDQGRIEHNEKLYILETKYPTKRLQLNISVDNFYTVNLNKTQYLIKKEDMPSVIDEILDLEPKCIQALRNKLLYAQGTERKNISQALQRLDTKRKEHYRKIEKSQYEIFLIN